MSTSIGALTPEAARAAKAFLRALQAAGVPAEVTSTRRSYQEQARLYRAYQAGESRLPAAAPGTSLHEKGLAIDIAMRSQYRAAAASIAADYGWQWAGSVDPVHYSYIGGAQRRPRARAAAVHNEACVNRSVRLGPPVRVRQGPTAITRSTALAAPAQIHGYVDPIGGTFRQTSSRYDAMAGLAKQQGWIFVNGVRDGAWWALTSPYSPASWLLPFKYTLATIAGQVVYERIKTK